MPANPEGLAATAPATTRTGSCSPPLPHLSAHSSTGAFPQLLGPHGSLDVLHISFENGAALYLSAQYGSIRIPSSAMPDNKDKNLNAQGRHKNPKKGMYETAQWLV